MRVILNSILFLVLILLLPSCYERHFEGSPKPEKLLSHEQMIEILTDIQLEEARVVAQRDKDKAYNNTATQYKEDIVKKYGISVEEFVENLNYYQDQDETLIDIYDEVLANLSRMQEDVKRQLEEEKELKRINDSIAEADSINLVISDSLKQIADTNLIAKPFTLKK